MDNNRLIDGAEIIVGTGDREADGGGNRGSFHYVKQIGRRCGNQHRIGGVNNKRDNRGIHAGNMVE